MLTYLRTCLRPSMASALLLLALLIASIEVRDSQPIGVCYGRVGNNLPPKHEVVDLFKSHNIRRARVYDPDPKTLQAFRRSNIELILDVPPQDLQGLAYNATEAQVYVQRNIRSYLPDVKFRYIAVGNEVSPVNEKADYVSYILPAMENIYSALAAAGLQNQIKVSTVIEMGVLGVSYPPSQGAFKGEVSSYLDVIISFLVNNHAPILVNLHPYISHVNTPSSNLQYALFQSPSPQVFDAHHQYHNLFVAMLDAVYSALEKAGGSSLDIVVSEIGWPSAGGPDASVENAHTFNQNLLKNVAKGTPKRHGKAIETYIFAMFNENQKTGPEYEKYWGLFYPNKEPVYEISFG